MSDICLTVKELSIENLRPFPEGWEVGYKGFDKDLKCKGFPYEVGKLYGTDVTTKPRVCSADGIHYCKTLEQVFQWYPNNNGNRFCKVYAGPCRSTDSSKSCSTRIYIVEELSKEEIAKEVKRLELEKIHKTVDLEQVKEFLTEYPMAHLAGSISLLIHGLPLKRLMNAQSDLDVVFPYFVEIASTDSNNKPVKTEEADYRSGSDFDYNTVWRGRKIDVVIDPKERYETIEYDGFKFKVNRLEDVLMAKLKYIQQGNGKHRADIYELLGKS